MLLVFSLSILVIIFIVSIRIKIILSIHEEKLNRKVSISIFNISLAKVSLDKKREKKRKNKNKKNKKNKNNKNKKIKVKNGKEKSGKTIYDLVKKFYKENIIYLEKFNLKIDISTKDALLTAAISLFVSSGIPIILKAANIQINPRRFFYRVNSTFENRNVLNIEFDCIASIKLAHIIYMLLKEWRCKRNGRETSNRKSYDYSYEQHKRNDRCKYNYWGSNKSDG